jgi:hypothetical protein
MANTFTVEDGYKILILDDSSKVPVTAPLSLDEGSYVRLIESQRLLLVDIKNSVDALTAAQGATNAQAVLSADDLEQAFTYLDPGTANQRVATVTYTSDDVGYEVLDSYTYAGSVGSYYLTAIARSVSEL